jgi:hypothetical protein
MTVQIIEILGRAKQGMTLPFICRADNGKTYFVKGIAAGRRSQICEWIAGSLGLKMELPIAPFACVYVPEELTESNLAYKDLGYGLAFGSCKQMIVELNYAGISQVDVELQRSVLAFDWWIQNEDRTLSSIGGNPNLFWKPETEELLIIDHNQAFDRNFSIENFQQCHVFQQQTDLLFKDNTYHSHYVRQFNAALRHWDEIYNDLPKEWLYIDPEQTIPIDFDLNDILKTLQRCTTSTFWETP